ncbi:MAG: hypothetical protein NFCOHLIN_00746 [Gammaproteobacteria bacterium]|nr:hypothetical protein [Gammaproteobacteria bacterium]
MRVYEKLTSTIARDLERFVDTVMAFLPGFFTALLLLVVGWVLARLLRFIIRRLGTGLDHLATTLGIADRMPWLRTKWSISRVLSGVVYWLTLLFFIVAAAESIGLPGVAHWITQGIGYTPRLFAAALIMLVAYALSAVMRDMLVSSALRLRREQSLLLARISHPLILVVAGLVAADQLGLDVGLLASLVTIVAAAGFGGLAFAFGMGAGSTVENIFAIRELRRIYRPGERVRVGEVEGVIVEFSSTAVIVDSQSGRVMVPGQVFGRQASILLDRSEVERG